MPATPQLSVAVAAPTLVGFKLAGYSSVILGGQAITGGFVSLMMIVIAPVATFPQASVAVQERMSVKRLPQVELVTTSGRPRIVAWLHESETTMRLKLGAGISALQLTTTAGAVSRVFAKVETVQLAKARLRFPSKASSEVKVCPAGSPRPASA